MATPKLVKDLSKTLTNVLLRDIIRIPGDNISRSSSRVTSNLWFDATHKDGSLALSAPSLELLQSFQNEGWSNHFHMELYPLSEAAQAAALECRERERQELEDLPDTFKIKLLGKEVTKTTLLATFDTTYKAKDGYYVPKYAVNAGAQRTRVLLFNNALFAANNNVKPWVLQVQALIVDFDRQAREQLGDLATDEQIWAKSKEMRHESNAKENLIRDVGVKELDSASLFAMTCTLAEDLANSRAVGNKVQSLEAGLMNVLAAKRGTAQTLAAYYDAANYRTFLPLAMVDRSLDESRPDYIRAMSQKPADMREACGGKKQGKDAGFHVPWTLERMAAYLKGEKTVKITPFSADDLAELQKGLVSETVTAMLQAVADKNLVSWLLLARNKKASEILDKAWLEAQDVLAKEAEQA